MSLHSSLKIDKAGTQQRTVLTRIERIKELMKKGLWTQEVQPVGLPKTKVLKIKARKAAKEGAPAEGAAAAPAAGKADAKAGAKPAAKPADKAAKK